MTTASHRKEKLIPGLAIAVTVLAGAFAYSAYYGYSLGGEYERKLTDASSEIATLTARISELEGEKGNLEESLEQEQSKIAEFEDEIGDISETVGTLHKLAKTDPELLAKYSKVYFLNENYIPAHLSLLDTKYAYDPAEELYFLTSIRSKLEELLDDAMEDGVDIKIASAYRSFSIQKDLKSSYTVTYGTGANKFSADQGYSEHQLGTTVDFTTASLNGSLTGFQNTPAYTWLVNNAHKYGFVLSYPPGNAYYIYEPWHWRYVGEDLAEDLKKDGKYFHDLEQREINEYLVSFFD